MSLRPDIPSRKNMFLVLPFLATHPTQLFRTLMLCIKCLGISLASSKLYVKWHYRRNITEAVRHLTWSWTGINMMPLHSRSVSVFNYVIVTCALIKLKNKSTTKSVFLTKLDVQGQTAKLPSVWLGFMVTSYPVGQWARWPTYGGWRPLRRLRELSAVTACYAKDGWLVGWLLGVLRPGNI